MFYGTHGFAYTQLAIQYILSDQSAGWEKLLFWGSVLAAIGIVIKFVTRP